MQARLREGARTYNMDKKSAAEFKCGRESGRLITVKKLGTNHQIHNWDRSNNIILLYHKTGYLETSQIPRKSPDRSWEFSSVICIFLNVVFKKSSKSSQLRSYTLVIIAIFAFKWLELWPYRYGIFGADADANIRGKTIPISNMSVYVLYIIFWIWLSTCVTKIHNGGRMCNKLHFKYQRTEQ